MRVHPGVVIHGFAGDVAQDVAETLGKEDEQRHDQHADEGQLPFERKHDSQDRDRFDDVGDDADDGVEARHQLADLGVGEETQGHPLQFAEERHAQIVDHASDAAGLIEALGIAPAHVVGISLGGMIAFQLAVDAPNLVRSLVIVNAAPLLMPKTATATAMASSKLLLAALFVEAMCDRGTFVLEAGAS